MKQIVFFTMAKFWLQGVGIWARSREMLKFLARQGQVTVIYLGEMRKIDIDAVRQFGGRIRFTWLGQPGKEDVPQVYWKTRYQQISHSLPQADIYFIDKIEGSFMLDVLPCKEWQGHIRPRFVIDMHDLVSARTAKHQHYDIPEQTPLTPDEERQILDRYDAVVCIQQNELRQVAQWIGEDKCLLVPHPLVPRPQLIREQARNIGFIASKWHANVNGLKRFLQNVWPLVREQNVYLYLFGFIANSFKDSTDPQIFPKGYSPSLDRCYEQLDIVINPVFYGAGLKIKSVEALSFGLPLVTTEEGASGLQHLDGSALLIARSDEEFAQYLIDLIGNQERRKQLSETAINYVTAQFSEPACFAPLKQFLNA